MTEKEPTNDILVAVEAYILEFFQKYIAAEYVYHDLQHTKLVVKAVTEIGAHYDLSEKEREILALAAWFHDTGYKEGAEGHEGRSCEIAEAFLNGHNYPADDIPPIMDCILATCVPQTPMDLLQEIICDADLAHLGNEEYWDRTGRVRQELLLTKSVVMSEQEWIEFEIGFMQKHDYHTEEGRNRYEKQKQKHIKQLKKQQRRLQPKKIESVDALAKVDEAKKKSKGKKKKKNKKNKSEKSSDELKEIRLGRGVETMYRTTYRTHVNLSSIADNKANIMLSINAVIISIVLPQLGGQFRDNPKLIVPTVILLCVCLAAMVFATLSTRPKITEGKFTRDDIIKRRSNLLFFGNYYNMKLEDFHWGMLEMIRDSDFLYSSMTRDLYYLGIVLSKKYRYLSLCYAIFMYGLIVAVLAFAIAFAI